MRVEKPSFVYVKPLKKYAMSNVRILSMLVTEQSREHAKFIEMIRAGKSEKDPEYKYQDGYCDGLDKAIKIVAELYDKENRGNPADERPADEREPETKVFSAMQGGTDGG